jgi:EmrB/QacA subfamily drug resistance transporter
MLHHIPLRQKILVMVAVMSGLFLVALDQTIISPALGKIVTDFNSFSSLGLVVTAYLLLSTVSVPIAGKMSDMFGRRPVLLTGVILFTIASFMSGISQNIDQLILFRAIQGLGGGIITANAFTIIGDLFTPRERGKWQGMFGAVFGLASVVGPLLGGFLTDAHTIFGLTTDWRWTFFINIPVGIFAAIIIGRYCPSIKHEKKPIIDYLGAGTLSVALASLVLAVDNPDTVFKGLIDAGMTLDGVKIMLYAISLVFTGLFVWAETKAKQPIIPLRFFKNRTFTSVMIAMTLFGAAFLGSILYLTQFNQQVFGANATQAGLMSLPMMGGMMVASTLVGQLVSRIGRYKIFVIIGFAVATIGVYVLTSLTPSSPYWHEAIIMVFIGMGLGTGMPIMNLAVQNEFEQKDLGAATSSNQLFRGLGSTLGTAVMSGILTVGVAAGMGNINHDPYIETLRKSPEAAKIVPASIDANSALQVNAQREAIKDGATTAINKLPVPDAVKTKQLDQFAAQQNDYKTKVINSFSDTIHTIFTVAALLMLLSLVAVLFIKERPLRDGSEDAPGVE